MGLEVRRVEKVDHGEPAGEEGIGDQRTVATPGERFRAEKDEAVLAGLLFQVIERRGEPGGLHVVGEASKALVPPSSVRGIPSRMAQAPEGSQVFVGDAASGQEGGKALPVELGVVAGAGNGSDVDDELDPMGVQDGNELL